MAKKQVELVRVDAMEVAVEKVARSETRKGGLCLLSVVEPNEEVVRVFLETRELFSTVRGGTPKEGPLPVRGESWEAKGDESASLEFLAGEVDMNDSEEGGKHRVLGLSNDQLRVEIHMSDELILELDDLLAIELGQKERSIASP